MQEYTRDQFVQWKRVKVGDYTFAEPTAQQLIEMDLANIWVDQTKIIAAFALMIEDGDKEQRKKDMLKLPISKVSEVFDVIMRGLGLGVTGEQ